MKNNATPICANTPRTDVLCAIGSTGVLIVGGVAASVCSTKGIERRVAVYRLADLSPAAYRSAPELVWSVADRAIVEAQEADYAGRCASLSPCPATRE